MIRQNISNDQFYRTTRKPVLIGIAGDSGSGKDTLVDSLVGLFGVESCAKVSGDDYHLWDRRKPMWQVFTHLNPLANDLSKFFADVNCLSNGQGIWSRHYNHDTGKNE